MRLKCEVDVVSRPVAGCSFRKASRPHQAIVTVGKEGTTQSNNVRVTLLISTAKNRQGTKYQLSKNISQLHARFVEEGKGTICLHEPARDICISKADPVQLKSLLSLLRLVTKGEDISKCALFTAVTAPSTSGMKALQTSMVITKRQDYPLTSSFPSGLKSLTVTGVSMKRLDPRIQDLQHLQTLSMASNLLTSFPQSPGRWRSLSELDLSSNQLTELPPMLYRSCVKDTLKVLRLDNNQLRELPLHLAQIKGLVRLHVDDNTISTLPPNIGNLSQLYVLSAQRNQVTVLPASLARLRLQDLHLFGNPLQPLAHNTLLSNNVALPSLRETTARFIRTKGLAYTEEDLLPGLIYYLDNARQCVCGRYCFESCARFLRKCGLHQLSETVHGWDTHGSTTVPLETFLCSASCLAKFNINPDRF